MSYQSWKKKSICGKEEEEEEEEIKAAVVMYATKFPLSHFPFEITGTIDKNHWNMFNFSHIFPSFSSTHTPYLLKFQKTQQQ